MNERTILRRPSDFLTKQYQALVHEGLNWKLRVLESASAPRCTVDGKNVLMLCSNNYLGFSNHPKLKEAAVRAVQTYGLVSEENELNTA